MPMTLNQMRQGMNDHLSANVVDEMIRRSEILELLPFDNAVSPGGGSTLIYGYMQTQLPSTTAFRAINTEYTASEATLTKKTAELKIFGGAFQMDRVIKQAEGQYNNMAFQLREKMYSAVGTFHNSMINGDSAVETNGFDGLDKMLVGKSTEQNTGAVIDLSDMAKLKANADQFYEALTRLMNETEADAILMNESMRTKIQTVARILGYKTDSEEAFGRKVQTIDGKRMVSLGNIYGVTSGDRTETAIVPIRTRTVGGTETTGLTDIYAIRFSAQDGFFGITLTGDKGIKAYLPDFNAPGAVKTGEVEMVAAVGLKNTRKAGVLRNVKIL